MRDGTNPNVLLVQSHDLGQFLGCYGVDVETPRVDALAEDGALFENHFTTAPQCSPSRSSLLTGRFPHSNGMLGLAHDDWEIHDDETVLPEYLRDAGYETHLFGLQHVSMRPERLGYDAIHSEASLSPDVDPSVHAENRARDVAATFSEFVEDAPEPFFANVGFFETHRVEDEEAGRFGFAGEEYDTPAPSDVDVPAYLPDCEGIRADLAEMHGMVRALDDAVGTITDALDRSGVADDTLVVFTTEHGIAFPRAKGTLFDPGIEGALLVRYPGVTDDAGRYDELVSNVDVLPTLLDAVGREAPENLAGRSFLPLLRGDEYAPRERVFAEMTWHDRYNPTRAVRTPQYKYVRNFWHLPSVNMPRDVAQSRSGRAVPDEYSHDDRAYEELYALDDDPHEQENLATDPDYRDVVERLRDELRRWMEATDDPLCDGPVPPADYDRITFPEWE